MTNQCLEVQERVTQELGELDEAIRQLLCKLYGGRYIGQLRVQSFYPRVGFLVDIGLPYLEKAFTIAADLPLDKFLTFAENELRTATLHSIDRTTVIVHDLKNIAINGKKQD